jgi:hypothetical protein
VQPGDVIIVLQEEKHDVFERQGQDLWTDKTISLVEALCGTQFPLTHLDGVRILCFLWRMSTNSYFFVPVLCSARCLWSTRAAT